MCENKIWSNIQSCQTNSWVKRKAFVFLSSTSHLYLCTWVNSYISAMQAMYNSVFTEMFLFFFILSVGLLLSGAWSFPAAWGLQQFVLFPVQRCYPQSFPLCSSRIYICHFSSVVNIYELHCCITGCVAAVHWSLGAIDPSRWASELRG